MSSVVDPADLVTRALPQPTRIQFASRTYIYSILLDQDLLGDWTVMQSWAGKGNRRGGGKITAVENFEAGLELLQAITKRREQHGYHLINNE